MKVLLQSRRSHTRWPGFFDALSMGENMLSESISYGTHPLCIRNLVCHTKKVKNYFVINTKKQEACAKLANYLMNNGYSKTMKGGARRIPDIQRLSDDYGFSYVQLRNWLIEYEKRGSPPSVEFLAELKKRGHAIADEIAEMLRVEEDLGVSSYPEPARTIMSLPRETRKIITRLIAPLTDPSNKSALEILVDIFDLTKKEASNLQGDESLRKAQKEATAQRRLTKKLQRAKQVHVSTPKKDIGDNPDSTGDSSSTEPPNGEHS